MANNLMTLRGATFILQAIDLDGYKFRIGHDPMIPSSPLLGDSILFLDMESLTDPGIFEIHNTVLLVDGNQVYPKGNSNFNNHLLLFEMEMDRPPLTFKRGRTD